MKSAILAFLLAVILTAGTTPIVQRIALAAGAVDEPGARRVHARRIPRMGGVAIVFGFFGSLLALLALHTQAAIVFSAAGRVTIGLIVGSIVIITAGLWDDV